MPKFECPSCGVEGKDWFDKLGRHYRCAGCGLLHPYDDIVVEPPPRRRRKAPTRSISDRHEKKTAKATGGRKTIGSGSTPVDKGDVKAAGLRIECKSTEAKGYRLKRDELIKIASQAQGDEIPVFAIEFRGEGFADEFYILPKAWALELLRNRNDLLDS